MSQEKKADEIDDSNRAVNKTYGLLSQVLLGSAMLGAGARAAQEIPGVFKKNKAKFRSRTPSILPLPHPNYTEDPEEDVKEQIVEEAIKASSEKPTQSNLIAKALGAYRKPYEQASWLHGHEAQSPAEAPIFWPLSILGGLGTMYGGYKLTNAILNSRRAKQIQEDVSDEAEEFNKALMESYDEDKLKMQKAGSGDKAVAKELRYNLEKLAYILKISGKYPPYKVEASGDLIPTSRMITDPIYEQAGIDPNAARASLESAGNIIGGLGLTALAGLPVLGTTLGYEYFSKRDPSKLLGEIARERAAARQAASPPKLMALPIHEKKKKVEESEDQEEDNEE
jgi:hypothetical protein